MVVNKPLLFDFPQDFAAAFSASQQIVERIAASVRIRTAFAVHSGLGFLEKVFGDEGSMMARPDSFLPAEYPVINGIVEDMGDHALADLMPLLASKALLVKSFRNHG